MKPHTLAPLPYPSDALQPAISRETVDFHYGKHHRGYVDKLNLLLPGTPWENSPLDMIVRETFQKERKIFNQAAQVWNHDFFWNSLSPVSKGGGKLESESIRNALMRDFGSFEKFKEMFNAAAAGVFGSGWAWLITDDKGVLKIETTSNADNPLRKGEIALLTCDVWEHSYYIDYRNERAKFLENIWSILNWDFAAKNYEQVRNVAAA